MSGRQIMADLRQDEMAEALSVDLDGNFEGFMRLYQDRMYAFALRWSNDARDAEEVVQDAFVRAYRAMQGYPAERTRGLALRPWLYRITLNLLHNRARQRRPAALSLDGATGEGGGGPWAEREESGPAAAVERVELQEQLARLLAMLPERNRTPITLRFVAGLKYAEIAELLAQPEGTVKANIHRGLRRLRSQMIVWDEVR